MRALLEVGELYPAIELMGGAVEADPANDSFRRTLFGLLGEAGRIELMGEHYEHLIRSRKFDVAVLLALTDTSQRLFPAESIKSLISRNLDDRRLQFGLAQSMVDNRQFADAEEVLREILARHLEFAPAHALLGRLPGVQHSADQEFSKWALDALPYCREQVNFWIAVGERYCQSENWKNALGCYLFASRIDPNMAIPWMQISLSVRRIATQDQAVISRKLAETIAGKCDQRARSLHTLRMHLQRFGGSGERSQRAAARIASTLADLGRYWEAEAWSAIATTLPDEVVPNMAELRRSIVIQLQQSQRWNDLPDLSSLDAFVRMDVIDRSQFGLASASKQRLTTNGDAIDLRLVDETKARNVIVPDARYSDIGSSLIDTLGTGGGALDYDLDGRSDLLFATGGASSSTLLRNIDGAFCVVTASSGCLNAALGQSVAIGDYNEDGFSDIFFANVGANRLLRNNGDGTYSDDSDALGGSLNQWSTGAAFVDLDVDGISDLVAINYCDLDSDVDKPCLAADGPAPCHPARFPADHDQILIGDGKGSIVPSFSDQLRQISPGRGLGIIAGTFASNKLSAFVANDMSANHLLRISDRGLAELGVPSGVAVDGQSLAQASMGIAFGDFDGDLDLDLFVTGFAREHNVYYEQRATGIWGDSSYQQSLIEPSLMTVGFGTQAIDLDANGIDELTITNGHIGDFGPEQPPLAQPFQLMRRSEDGKYSAVEAKEGDAYRLENHIGRALWKIDVDQDLADDLVVTHQNAPPVLLANRTETENQRIGLQCIGTTISRDAIGAKVNFFVGGAERAFWLLSGDGYMCSNERIIKAGLGPNERVEEVTVTWPNGKSEAFGTLAAGHAYLLVEGSGEPYQSN